MGDIGRLQGIKYLCGAGNQSTALTLWRGRFEDDFELTGRWSYEVKYRNFVIFGHFSTTIGAVTAESYLLVMGFAVFIGNFLWKEVPHGNFMLTGQVAILIFIQECFLNVSWSNCMLLICHKISLKVV